MSSLGRQSPAPTANVSVVGSRYGWGPIPMLSVYDAANDLPVLPWSRAL